jgi:GAF domain-containing protein
MTKPPLPANEAERIRALRDYRILDTAPETVFDDIALIASTLCRTPIALMTLVDADRQWVKARVGLKGSETPRDQAFCAYTILGDDLLVVEDAQADRRFVDNPMVTSDPHIRFYVGAPLIDSKGHALGSICAIDRKPRQITRQQKRSLSALARAIVAHLEVRRVSAELAASLEDLKTVRGLLPICSHCKGVRDDQGYWSSVEDYLSTHGGLDLTHGICPSCMKAHHPGLYRKMRRKGLV